MEHREVLKVIEKVDINELIVEHIRRTGTDESFFIADVGDVVRKYVLWRELMPRIDSYFAIKCNDHPGVAGTLAALGTGFDCASKGEIEKVLRMGVSPEKIVFAQTVKPVSHLIYAKEKNVRLMTFDNEEELHKVKKHFPEADLLLRLRFNPQTRLKKGFGEKFGCSPGKNCELLLRKARELNLNVKGIAFHIGMGFLGFDIFAEAIKESAAAFDYGNSLGLKMDLLDIGGGFPGSETETITGVSKVINESLEKYFPDPKIKIISEPGTYFAEKALTLGANVHSKNVKINEKGEEIFHYYITDGIYQSFNMNFSHDLPIEIETLRNIPEKALKKSIVWGRACDPYDVVLRDVLLPELEVGEWLVFPNCGAYHIATSTLFNGFPNHPVYSFIDRETWETFKKIQVANIKLAYEVEG